MTVEALRRLLNKGATLDIGSLEGVTAHEKAEFLKIAKESANRECEALRLYLPLPFQQEFHKCTAKEALIVKGNRAGGSLAGFAEDARAVTGQDPFDKYPKRDGTCVCLGFGEKHIGRVIHKFLFRAGSFRIIRDLETREWRVFKPWEDEKGGDASRSQESKMAPPLIPPRFIEEIIWASRGDRVFSVCRMTNGWEIMALNSAGDPSQAQGFDVDLYHIDEDTATPGWYEEAVGRVAMTRGKIRWTALPHSKNDDILNMMERADDEASLSNPTTVCIKATMFDNIYYPEESRLANLKIWSAQGEDVVRKRAYGEMVTDMILMYPSYSKWVHDIVCPDPERECLVQKQFRENKYTPPTSWTKDLLFDPGHTIAAVLFIATPPPSIGDFHVVYEEIYIHQCSADIFADRVKEVMNDGQFQRFIIDAHGGRLTDFGSGIRPQIQYENAMKDRGISCNQSQHYFIAGSDDIKGREQVLRSWFQVGSEGQPKLFIVVGKCPNLSRELTRFKKKQQRVGGQLVTLDEANRSGQCHAIEALEYGAAHGLPYVAPRVSRIQSTIVSKILSDRADRALTRKARSPEATSSSISLAPRGV